MSSLALALGQASTILPTYIPPFLWSASRVPVGTYKSLKNSDIFGTALRALTFLGGWGRSKNVRVQHQPRPIGTDYEKDLVKHWVRLLIKPCRGKVI